MAWWDGEDLVQSWVVPIPYIFKIQEKRKKKKRKERRRIGMSKIKDKYISNEQNEMLGIFKKDQANQVGFPFFHVSMFRFLIVLI